MTCFRFMVSDYFEGVTVGVRVGVLVRVGQGVEVGRGVRV